MTYEQLYTWAGSYGLLFLFILFLVSVAYALWPSNKTKFDSAAQQPLQDDDLGQ
ncbi:MAG: cbb3-type cytochrome c oxidase subunit 3 [Sphingomonadales bacterium]